ncbi:MAG: VOC family protein [Solirubrobacteraceae bacterium]
MSAQLPEGVRAVFDHAAHASHRIRDMLALYRDQLGGEFLYGGPNRRVGYRGVVLGYAGGGKIELLEPLPGSTFLDSFFARNPLGGLHHLTFRVADLADAAERARAGGFALLGENHDDPNWREVFVHPRAGHGVLVQFVQAPADFPRRDTGETLEEVLDA